MSAASAARRPATAMAQLPGLIAYAVLTAAVTAVAATTPFNGYLLHILVQMTTYAIAVLGLTVVLGLCGQINLAQAAFFGLGAYAVGIGIVDLKIGFWPALLLGGIVASAAGAFLGLATLRLGGHYLAMVTISFQQILNLVLVNWIPVTHGPDGIGHITRPWPLRSDNAFLALCVVVLALAGFLVFRLPATRLGRAMRAVRDNELAASVAGIDVYRVKVAAFALCALLGGIAGGFFAAGFTYISPDQFAFADSIVFLTMVLLGGSASPIGAFIGTALLIILPETLRFLKDRPGEYLAIYGLAVILIIRFVPDGIWGFVAAFWRRMRPATPVAAGTVPELTLAPQGSGDRLVLRIEGLAKHFGGLKAVDGVTFAVRRGGVHALIGPNGSGKTTTLNVISGLYATTGGSILLDGHDITRLPPHRRTAVGLGRTFQNIRLFRSMTALENVVIGAERPGRAPRLTHAALVERARAALAYVGLAGREDQFVTGFSYGHQRLIEIARALAADPALLLLDEPAAGLNSTEKLALHDLLARIAGSGLSILIIDHDMTLVSEVAQHITVLNFGRRIADGVGTEVLRQPDVVAAYLGSDNVGSEPDGPAVG